MLRSIGRRRNKNRNTGDWLFSLRCAQSYSVPPTVAVPSLFALHSGNPVVISLAFLVAGNANAAGVVPALGPLPAHPALGLTFWSEQIIMGERPGEGWTVNPKGREQEPGGGRMLRNLGPASRPEGSHPGRKRGSTTRVGEIGWKRGEWAHVS